MDSMFTGSDFNEGPMTVYIGRRELLGAFGAAVTWPLAARGQQPRRVGVLMSRGEDDPQSKRNLAAFREALRSLGWIEGQDIQIEHRGAPDLDGMRSGAAELLRQEPDLMVTVSTPATNVVRQASASMRIVFVGVSDPIGPGFVKSFDHPGGNITGFTMGFEETMGGKWLELLREIAPSVKRAAMLFNPETANAGASGGLYLKSIETAARNTGTELIVSAVHDPAGIDELFAAMAQGSSGGVLVMPNTFMWANREHIVAQAERYRVPTIYPMAEFVAAGGLLSYGIDPLDMYRRAASYVDRILKGANPSDLPVQAPIKFELEINKRTATALGLSVPNTLLVTADAVIE
jgi:putative tryptophan/tyrosine transport system substrate-binding protein